MDEYTMRCICGLTVAKFYTFEKCLCNPDCLCFAGAKAFGNVSVQLLRNATPAFRKPFRDKSFRSRRVLSPKKRKLKFWQMNGFYLQIRTFLFCNLSRSSMIWIGFFVWEFCERSHPAFLLGTFKGYGFCLENLFCDVKSWTWHHWPITNRKS